MLSAAIVGATGYTGVELIRLLSRHPKIKVNLLISRSQSGVAVSDYFPSLRGLSDLIYQDLDQAALTEHDLVFFATPHGVAMAHAPYLLKQGVKVIDLAADFRLQDTEEFKRWYGMPHAAVDILPQAVYGLSEVNREAISQAKIVGNPGCYPTTALLGLEPLLKHDKKLIEPRIIIDAKSGISGAGKKASTGLIYSELADNFKAYGVSGHRHSAEIMQGLHAAQPVSQDFEVSFTPHLVPMIRGMFTTIYVTLTDHALNLDIQSLFEQRYANELFVDVLPKGSLLETRSVKGSNRLQIALHQHERFITILVVQDNLVKGAAGQAVQNANIMFGLDEALGLDVVALSP